MVNDPKTVEYRTDALHPEIDNVGSCSREELDGLARTMGSNTESALRPLLVSLNLHGGRARPAAFFRGLDAELVSSAFSNTRIALLGDSTMGGFDQYLQVFLRSVITSKQNPDSTMISDVLGDVYPSIKDPMLTNQPWEKMSLSDANIALHRLLGESKIKRKAQFPNYYPKTFQDDYYHVLPLENHDAVMFRRLALLDDMVLANTTNALVEFQPKVVVANAGLWLLHMKHYWGLSQIIPWLNYESILEALLLAAENSGAEILLFKTTNFICERRYRNAWKTAQELYSQYDPKTIGECVTAFGESHPDVEESLAVRYCSDGVIIGRGSDGLNKRLYQFVEDAQRRLQKSGSSLKMAVFNDHDMQSCDTTTSSDGRHHYKMNLARARLLGNYINCLNS